MSARWAIVKLTPREASAAIAEIRTAMESAEANPGPYHPQHHDAKRAMRKLEQALNRTGVGR